MYFQDLVGVFMFIVLSHGELACGLM